MAHAGAPALHGHGRGRRRGLVRGCRWRRTGSSTRPGGHRSWKPSGKRLAPPCASGPTRSPPLTSTSTTTTPLVVHCFRLVEARGTVVCRSSHRGRSRSRCCRRGRCRTSRKVPTVPAASPLSTTWPQQPSALLRRHCWLTRAPNDAGWEEDVGVRRESGEEQNLRGGRGGPVASNSTPSA